MHLSQLVAMTSTELNIHEMIKSTIVKTGIDKN